MIVGSRRPRFANGSRGAPLCAVSWNGDFWEFFVGVAWHPIFQTHFCSGGMDGSLLFWSVGYERCCDYPTELAIDLVFLQYWSWSRYYGERPRWQYLEHELASARPYPMHRFKWLLGVSESRWNVSVVAHLCVHRRKFWTRNRPGDTMKDKYNAQSRSETENPLDLRMQYIMRMISEHTVFFGFQEAARS